MIFEIIFASSLEMPSLMAASMRYSLPLGNGLPASSDRSEMLRLISFCSKTSSTAFTRSSALAFISTFSPDISIEAPTFLKS